MLRIKRTILREELFDILKLSISKIELLHNDNFSLQNQELCRVNIYFFNKTPQTDLSKMMAAGAELLRPSNKTLTNKQRQGLHNILEEIKKNNYIKETNIDKLFELGISFDLMGTPTHYIRIWEETNSERLLTLEHLKDLIKS